MCEAKTFTELKFEIIELKDEVKEKIQDWNNHFEWLKSLNTDKGPVEKEPTKLKLFFEKIKDVFEILHDVSRYNINYYYRLFLKWYFRKREIRIRDKITRIQSKFDKKFKKKFKKSILFRERWFQVRINLGEVI